jgi:predicted nuclease of predicted toxin-antitoxin system
LLSASDEEILKFAVSVQAIIVSADSDFAMLLALGALHTPPLVLLRSIDHLSPDGQADLLLANLPTVTEYLAAGAVVSLSRKHLQCGNCR